MKSKFPTPEGKLHVLNREIEECDIKSLDFDNSDVLRSESNADQVYIGKYEDSYVIIGHFGSFISGTMYFGNVLINRKAYNGLKVSTKGCVSIIISHLNDKPEIKLSTFAPKSRTHVEDFDVPISSQDIWEQILETAYSLKNSLNGTKGSSHDLSTMPMFAEWVDCTGKIDDEIGMYLGR